MIKCYVKNDAKHDAIYGELWLITQVNISTTTTHDIEKVLDDDGLMIREYYL